MSAAPSAATAAPQPQQGRSWKQMVLQAIMFQLVMRFLSPRSPQQQPRDPATGQVIPPLLNAYTSSTPFDLYVYLSTNGSQELADVYKTSRPVWFLPSQEYNYDRRTASRVTPSSIQYTIPDVLFGKLLEQHHQENQKTVESGMETPQTPKAPDAPSSIAGATERVLGTLGGSFSKLRVEQERRKSWDSIYLLAFSVPHSVYEKHDATRKIPRPTTLDEAVAQLQLIDELERDHQEHIVRGRMNLIEYMKPFGPEEGQHLLAQVDANDNTLSKSESEEPHWKNHLDIRMVVDASPLHPQNLATPHLKRHIVPLPEEGLYLPILYPSDMWLLERNYVLLNDTLRNQPLNLTLTFNSLNMLWWSVQAQLQDLWNPSDETPVNPLFALQSHSKKEAFLLKRVIMDTNPYLLAFSGVFMALHTLFSFLAFKNDIQFWHRNESMQGLSVLTIVFNFLCEVVIALYLYDSEETSFLILFEIFLGLALSAWKVTKAINVSLKWGSGCWYPTLQLEDKKNYKESETKKYDQVAIRFMSILLLPCMLGYAGYALKYKKFKSWYSYVISTLAGTVYTFGFILMTPQLYINYKLKSVDHLPWRAFTYKALNTFVDDIAAFIIDMPWMHRLACFRDDIIFICYLYQRWIYSVDKSRPSEWVAPAEETTPVTTVEEETAQLLEPTAESDVAATSEPSTVRQRKQAPSSLAPDFAEKENNSINISS